MWRSEIRSGHSLAILALFGGCPAREVMGQSDTVRWLDNTALVLGAPGVGLQLFLDVNRLVETMWWQTWKVMELHPKGGDTPKCDGRSFAPNVEYFAVSLLSEMLMECAITTLLEPAFV